jgi:heptosyltransferase-1
MKVLLVKTSSMGDVIHTFPAVTDLLANRHGTVVDWLVEEPFAPLAALHPGIRQVIPVAMRRWRRQLFSPQTWGEVRGLRRRLHAERYDLVVDAQGLLKSALLAWLAGAPVQGLDRASIREPAASYLYRVGHSVARGQHAIQRTRKLFGAVFGYTPELSRLDHGIALPEPAEPPTVFLLHGTSREDKKWPVADWIETTRQLDARGFRPVTTWSNAAEREVAAAIASAVPETTVLEKMPLGALAEKLGRSSLVIGADTGLTHLANAYGIPTVAVFTATRPGLTGPLGPRSVALTLWPPLKGPGASASPRQQGKGTAGGIQPREIPCQGRIAPADVMKALDVLLAGR